MNEARARLDESTDGVKAATRDGDLTFDLGVVVLSTHFVSLQFHVRRHGSSDRLKIWLKEVAVESYTFRHNAPELRQFCHTVYAFW